MTEPDREESLINAKILDSHILSVLKELDSEEAITAKQVTELVIQRMDPEKLSPPMMLLGAHLHVHTRVTKIFKRLWGP